MVAWAKGTTTAEPVDLVLMLDPRSGEFLNGWIMHGGMEGGMNE